jgi:hypothetical protein
MISLDNHKIDIYNLSLNFKNFTINKKIPGKK